MPKKDMNALQESKTTLKKKVADLRPAKKEKLKDFRKAKKKLRRVSRRLKVAKLMADKRTKQVAKVPAVVADAPAAPAETKT
jgi:hypothetical protein